MLIGGLIYGLWKLGWKPWLFSSGRRGTRVSTVICCPSEVWCLKCLVYRLDSARIVAPSPVTLKVALYSELFLNLAYELVCYLIVDRQYIQILEDQMSDWIVLRARCGAIVVGETFHNNRTNRGK